MPEHSNLVMRVSRLAGEEQPATPARAGDDWWDSEDPSDPLDSIRLFYRPLWDVHHNTLAYHVCTPVSSDAAGKPLLGEDEIAAGADVTTVNRLDMLMQRQVIGDLRHMLATGRKLPLCLPVHLETFASTDRRAPYLDRCRRGIPRGGERFLAFELVGTPPGAPQGRLLELTSALKRHARAVFLRTRSDHAGLRRATESGLAAVGFTYPAHADERAEIENLRRFAAAARKAGIVPYVRGMRSLSLATSAVGAGFEFIDGDVVAAAAKPLNAYQFGLHDPVTRQLGATG